MNKDERRDRMLQRFPGTTIEVACLKKGDSKRLFDGIFAAGGITLSQACVMTGLEPHVIQNWVKRGFISSPQKRMYSKEQFARIIIINMLKEELQLERICELVRVIGGALDNRDDDLISDDELYHRYVDMIAENQIDLDDKNSVAKAAKRASADFEERIPNTRSKLTGILQVMLYAHSAALLRDTAENILWSLE